MALNNKLSRNTSSCGFTFIETLVAIAIAGVLTALAMPSFADMIKRWRINSIRDELTSTLEYAKSEAIRRGLPVIVRSRTDCVIDMPTSDDWACGWRVIVDVNQNGTANANEPIIQIVSIPSGFDVVQKQLGPQIIVTRFGQLQGVGKKFIISPTGPGITDPATTTICISIGGRIRYVPGDFTCFLNVI